MNKKGFTLVELLVVITIMGLLIVIAVPASLKISKTTKKRMYDAKIELIEKAAIVWGQENKSTITGILCDKSDRCMGKRLNELIEANAIEPDSKDDDGNKVITNPTNNANMNGCVVFIYVKNNRVYAEFQKELSGDPTYKSNCSPSN